MIFREGKNVLLHRDGTKFPIHVHNKLYYLHTKDSECVDQCKKCNDLQTWHEILGHCNYKDIIKLQDVVDGVTVHGSVCSFCVYVCVVCGSARWACQRCLITTHLTR